MLGTAIGYSELMSRNTGECQECGKGIGHFLKCSQHPDAEQRNEISAELRNDQSADG